MEKKKAEDSLEDCVEKLIRAAADVNGGVPGADISLKLTQAACNAANALRVLRDLKHTA